MDCHNGVARTPRLGHTYIHRWHVSPQLPWYVGMHDAHQIRILVGVSLLSFLNSKKKMLKKGGMPKAHPRLSRLYECFAFEKCTCEDQFHTEKLVMIHDGCHVICQGETHSVVFFVCLTRKKTLGEILLVHTREFS